MSSAFLSRNRHASSSLSSSSTYKPLHQRTQSKSLTAILSRIFNWSYNTTLYLWKKLKGLMWIGTTAAIFIVIPVAFAIMMETEFEYQKLERATNIASGNPSFSSF